MSWIDVEAQAKDHWGETVNIDLKLRTPNTDSLFFTRSGCAEHFEPTRLFLRQRQSDQVLRIGEQRELNNQTRSWLRLQSLVTPFLNGEGPDVRVQLQSVHSRLAEFSVCAHEFRDEVSGQPYHFVANGRWVVAVDRQYTVSFDLQGKYHAPTFERPVGEYHTSSRLILRPALPRQPPMNAQGSRNARATGGSPFGGHR